MLLVEYCPLNDSRNYRGIKKTTVQLNCISFQETVNVQLFSVEFMTGKALFFLVVVLLF